MKTTSFINALLLSCGLAGFAYGEQPPHIGYCYPAGGQRGSTFHAIIGGQYLEGSTNVFVSGEGVKVDIVKFSRKYDVKEYRNLQRSRANSLATMEGKEGVEREKIQRRIDQIDRKLALAEIPENMGKGKLKGYKPDEKEQFNPQIADLLRVDVTIAANAPPGERELRVDTPSGLSNPIYFEVGVLSEVQEAEPNDDHMSPNLQMVALPAVINGQIRPGDIDHFRFQAQKGQSIVVDVGARKIIPYLADAVPGWFQAIATLYDEDGNEVAYQDDYKFNPDPVLFYDVPQNGTYTLAIKDSIYRGREDFVYRIAIGELPFITSIFPLGAEQGRDVDIALSGKNLPKNRLTGKLPNEGGEVRHVSIKKAGYRSNLMPFAIGELKEEFEVEPNNAPDAAQPVQEPLTINGTIGESGDRDVFSFSGRKGDSVSIEVIARRLNSPLDSVVTLTGPGIDKPVRNDDYVNTGTGFLFLGSGLVTHHADSYLLQALPATGTYFVQIEDAQAKGGSDYGYRLRISPASPDFKLRMEPSGVQIAPGGTAAFTVRALRTDGFDQPIRLEVKNLPAGFEMSESIIPTGADSTRFTITAPKEIQAKSISPEISGTGIVNGRPVTRAAVPVDDQMQAFLYRHLVPAQELVLAPVAEPAAISFEIKVPKSGVIELPLGEEVKVAVSGHFQQGTAGAKLKIDKPPEGLTFDKGYIGRKKPKDADAEGRPKFDKSLGTGQITLKAAEPLKPGYTTSIIVCAELKQGGQETLIPSPAILVKVVKARGN